MKTEQAALLHHLSQKLSFLSDLKRSAVLEALKEGGRATTFRLTCGYSPSRNADPIASMSKELLAMRATAPSVQQCTWYPSAYALALGQQPPLAKHEIQSLTAVKHGHAYFQSLASMLPALGLDARPHMKVVDLCAAPGGKATLLAADPAALAGTGHLLAVDSDFSRLQRLVHNAKTLIQGSTIPEQRHQRGRSVRSDKGPQHEQPSQPAAAAAMNLFHISNMTVAKADGRHLQVDRQGLPLLGAWGQGPASGGPDMLGRPPAKGGPFDRVLVDAPCSGSGRVQLHDARSYLACSPAQLAKNVARQKQLLWNGAVLLCNGGTLVYSTCSLFPEECEQVVQWLLDNHSQMGLVEVTLSPAFAAAAAAVAAASPASDSSSSSTMQGALFGVRSLLSTTKLRLTDLLTRPQETAAPNKQGLLPLHPAPAWSVMPALDTHANVRFDRDMPLAVRLLPCWHHEGFFMAKLRKRQ